jgi:hypothetical protein
VAGPPRSLWRWLRFYALRKKGVERARRWRRGRPATLARRAVTYLLAALLVLLVVRAVAVVIRGEPINTFGWFDPDAGCSNNGYSCGVVNSILMTFLTLAFAGAVFLSNRVLRVRRPYARRAREETRDLVQTAGTIIDEVVGRDQLCHVIMDDLRDRNGRRPHVVIGGAGVGKTAVLYRLTRVLAENGAIPVPIRLRDDQTDLDFSGSAKQRFVKEIAGTSISDAEGERIWRELCRNDQIVVLADGLEEALSGPGQSNSDGDEASNAKEASADRDNRIRLALREAYRDRLPIVLASRPHDALVGIDAAVIELEPLSEEAALEHIEEGTSTHDEHRIDWVVETAEVTEAPLYLQIARELHSKGLLEQVTPGDNAGTLDTRTLDRAMLRVRLLEAWVDALVRGNFVPELPMPPIVREATVAELAALACMGLKRDTIEVAFADLFEKLKRDEGSDARPDHGVGGPAPGPAEAERADHSGNEAKNGEPQPREPYRYANLMMYLQYQQTRARMPAGPGAPAQDTLSAEDSRQLERAVTRGVEVGGVPTRPFEVEREIRLAATRGAQLRLVEPRRNGVRFPHSVMQAYLASRLIDIAVSEDTGYLDKALQNPGRELLTALVMYSRRRREGPPPKLLEEIREKLREYGHARANRDPKRIELLVAAIEIDCVTEKPQHRAIADELEKGWEPTHVDGTLEQTKLTAISRLGEVARAITRRTKEEGFAEAPAYGALYRIACKDLAYRVRLAAAQEIAAGGDRAFNAGLGSWSGQPTDAPLSTRLGPDFPDEPRAMEKQVAGDEHDGPPAGRADDEAPAGGDDDDPQDPGDDERGWNDPVDNRELVIRAWLAPLLVGSTDSASLHARKNLDKWLKRVESSEQQLPLSGEIALAQGFKHAANRRRRHPHARAAARGDLAERAAEMLEDARFWYSRLTLVQALCLWAIPEPGGPPKDKPLARYAWRARGRALLRRMRPRREKALSKPRTRGTDARALIGHWLSSKLTGDEHPFVAEARELAEIALERGEPERYMWIDESGVVTRIGSLPPRADAVRKHNLWIPPSTGWSALHPRAQRLVADVLLLLNLAERGDTPAQREKRLKRAMRDDLPPCLTGERDYLAPGQTVGMVELPPPGASCKDGCGFNLCPYPAKGGHTYRVELSEAFCRRQQVLLGRYPRPYPRRTARWQGAMPGHLKKFWRAMEDRARL